MSTRKIIIVSIICIFVIAPVAAWSIVQLTREVTKDTPKDSVTAATDADLTKALEEYSLKLPESQRFTSIDGIVSSDRYDDWWYITVFKISDSAGSFETPILFSKFNNSRPIAVVNRPGNQLESVNISGGRGVPYSVIDKFNEKFAEYYEFHDTHGGEK